MSVSHDLNGASGLAVIILNWNNARDTIRCVGSLASWKSIRPEVYLVDNASTDHSAKEIRLRFPGVEIIKNEKNLGFAGGNNVAIRKALESGVDEILLLNNDASVAEADVSRLLATLRGRPDVAAIGPRIRVGDSVLAGGHDIGHYIDPHIHWSPGMGLEEIKNVDYIPGTVFLVRSEAIKKVGLLDEEFFFSGEIADLCRRINDAGMVCCIDLGAEAIHMVDRSSRINDMLHVYYSRRNRFLYVKKHCKNGRLLLYGKWIRYCLGDLAFSIIKGNRWRSKAIVLALYDGVGGRFGDRNERFSAQRCF